MLLSHSSHWVGRETGRNVLKESQRLTNHRIHAAILYYDWFLTLPAEVSGVWARKKSIVSWVFLINRYLTLFGTTIVMVLSGMSLDAEVSVTVIVLVYRLTLDWQLIFRGMYNHSLIESNRFFWYSHLARCKKISLFQQSLLVASQVMTSGE